MIPMRTLGVARRSVAALGAVVGAFGLFDLPYGRGTHLLLGLSLLGSAALPFSRRLEAQGLARALWLQVLLVSVMRLLWGSARELGPALATTVVLCASLTVLGFDRLADDERSPLARLRRYRVSAALGAGLAAMQAVSCAWLGALQLERFGTLNLALPLSAVFALSALALMHARTVGLALSAVASGAVAILVGSNLSASPQLAVHFGLAVAQLAVLTPLWRAVGGYLTREHDGQADRYATSDTHDDQASSDGLTRIATVPSDPDPDVEALDHAMAETPERTRPAHS
jgi:hypothetical protein